MGRQDHIHVLVDGVGRLGKECNYERDCYNLYLDLGQGALRWCI